MTKLLMTDAYEVFIFRFRDELDDPGMEVGWREVEAEEKRSARLGEFS